MARARSRRRLVIVLLLVPAVLAAAAVAIWYVLPRYVSQRANRAIARIADVLDLEIAYEQLSLDGLSGIVLDGVTVSPRDGLEGEPPLCTVDRLVIDLAGSSILRGKLRLSAVRLVGPKLNLLRRPDGTDNFAELRARLQSLIRRGVLRPDADPSSSRLWTYFEKHVPRVEVTGGVLSLGDRSSGRGLVPPGMPDTIVLPALELVMVNEAVMAAELQLEATATADVPLLGSAARATARFDRRTDRLELAVSLLRPAAARLGERSVSISRGSWTLGGSVRLGGVRVGEDFEAREVVIWPEADARPAAGAMDDLLRLYASHVRKLELLEPTLRLRGPNALAALFEAASGAQPKPNVPAAEATINPPLGKRPKLTKEKGAKVREMLTGLFQAFRRDVRELGTRVHAIGQRLPLPELTIRLGRLVQVGEEGGSVLGALSRFDLVIQRPDPDMVSLRLAVAKPDGPAGAGAQPADLGALVARLQLSTGDLQVDIEAKKAPLQPYQALLPSWVSTGPGTFLRDTRLRAVYGAGSDRFELQGEWHVDGLTLDVPWIAQEPMEALRLGGMVKAAAELGKATLTVEDSHVELGAVRIDTALGVRDFVQEPVLRWRLRLARTPAQRIVDSLPAAFLGQLQGLRLSGDIEWSFAGSLDTRDMSSLEYTSRLDDRGLAVEHLSDRIDLSMVTRPFVHRVQEPDGTVLELLTGPGSAGWVPLGAVSPYMAKVLTTTEDGSFYGHGGIAWFAVRDALVQNLERGRFYRGASTITQQLVKNVFLIREKTISRKAQELFLASSIERLLSKDSILELYLNVIELGPEIYGLRKAAWHYFGKTPDELLLSECIHLGTILPSPRRYYYMVRRGAVTPAWQKGIERIAHVMLKRKKITQQELDAAAPFAPELKQKR